jgi:hypothetical protein
LFNVILPLRVKAARELSFRELVKRMFSEWKQSIQRQPGRCSLAELTLLYQHAASLFDVLVSYESRLLDDPPEWLHGDLDLEPISMMITILDYPQGKMEIEFLYRIEKFTEPDICSLYDQFLGLWRKLLADPERSIQELRSSR